MSELAVFPQKGTPEEQISFLIKRLDLPIEPCKARIRRMAGGISNTVYYFETPEIKSVVRVYGTNTDLIIDRDVELRNIQKIGSIEVYNRFDNGVMLSYLPGRPIDVPMMSDELISSRIAKQLGRVHSRTINDGITKNEIFDRVSNFIDQLSPDFQKDGVYVDIEDLNQRLKSLKGELNEIMKDSPIILCHNDLLAGNVLWDGKDIGFVDYEYSGYTWPEFDIANHFCEWCGFQLELSRFPNIDQQRKFITWYLEKLTHSDPTPEEVEKWVVRVNALVNLSNLFWGSWAFFQAANSDVDFPYFEYATWRIKMMDLKLPLDKDDPLCESNCVDI